MSIIFLYWPPGSGKSTLRKSLSITLTRDSIDTDTEFEKIHGQTVWNYIVDYGLVQFRNQESILLKELVQKSSRLIISLGGGSLLWKENREIAEYSWKVILLMGEIRTLIERVSQDTQNKRPLLSWENPKKKMRILLQERENHYDSFKLRVSVDNKTPEQVELAILALLWSTP